jgi:low temperature requirement protein LtrA
LHAPRVAGIVVAAVGDELLLAHPGGHSDIKAMIGMIGGPLLFLLGVIAFKYTIRGLLQLSHLVGIGALVVLIPFAHMLSPLALSATTAIIMSAVAACEAISFGATRSA